MLTNVYMAACQKWAKAFYIYELMKYAYDYTGRERERETLAYINYIELYYVR